MKQKFIFGNGISKNKIKRKVNQEVAKRTYKKIEYSKENLQILEIVWENIKQIDIITIKYWMLKWRGVWEGLGASDDFKPLDSKIE